MWEQTAPQMCNYAVAAWIRTAEVKWSDWKEVSIDDVNKTTGQGESLGGRCIRVLGGRLDLRMGLVEGIVCVENLGGRRRARTRWTGLGANHWGRHLTLKQKTNKKIIISYKVFISSSSKVEQQCGSSMQLHLQMKMKVCVCFWKKNWLFVWIIL